MVPLTHYLNYQACFQQSLQCQSKCHLFLCRLSSCLYLCDIIFVILHILVPRNNTKTHILISYSFLSVSCLLFILIFNFSLLINFITYLLILKNLNRLLFSYIFAGFFISFLWLINFHKKFLMYDSLVLTLNTSFLL